MEKFIPDVQEALKGHTSMETAYLVDDYPYGFRLRCKIRYWIEYKTGKGFRFWSQTSNPKVAGLIWNKPKASTYIANTMFMYLDSNGHVQWHGLGIYNNAAESREFLDSFREFINPEWLPVLNNWINRKTAYEKIYNDAQKMQEPKVDTIVYEVNYGDGRLEEVEVKK